MSTSFDDLLQDAEQMSAQIDKENSGMPRLQRTLGQLIEFNKRKLSRTTGGSTGYLPSSDSNEINASILLAARGIDAPKLTQTIESLVPPVATISATTTLPSQANQAQSEFSPFEKFANMEYLRDVDLASFLKSEREQALMQLINESRERQSEAVEEAFEQASENEWEKQKQRIMNELLGTFGSSSTDLNSTPAVTLSTIGTSRQSNMTRTLMTDVEMEFAKQVFIYNQRLIESNIGGSTGGKGDLLQTFRGLSQRLNDKNLEEAWDMLYFMSGGSSSELLRQNDETEQSIDRSNSAQMQAFFVAQAVGYLERCFRDIVQAKVSANLKQARLGGQLGTLPLCSAYLRLSVSEKYHLLSVEKFDGDGSGQQQPLWPTIYLCLRCGDAEAARNVALRAKKDDVALYLDEILKDASPRSLGHLSQSSENKLKIEYKSRIRRDQDVYKRAVYSFLCRYSGDDESIKDVLDNVDDFLWFKLNSILITGGDGKQAANTSLVRESSGITGESTLSFADFQAKMSIEFGEKYFVKNRNPFTYLQVLLLTAQFELAIEFMLKFETLLVHAVHMALGLYERGLLNVLKSSHSSQLISCVETPSSVGDSSKISIMRRVNLPSLIRMYTRKFECSDPREALQYYYFLRALRLPTEDAAAVSASSSLLDPTLPRIDNYFAKFVCELALETREFEMLFGCLEKNAVRRPGLVDKFVGSNEREVDAIIGLVANEMDQRGLVEEAIKLFDLSKQHKRVFELCNKLLNQVVTEVNVPNSTRDRIKSMILSIALRYKTETNMSARAIPTSVVYTFYLLTDLMQFFDLYHEENWEIAYETLCKLSILPTTSLQVESKVKDFVAFSEEIKRNFPELLLAAMTIISNLYAKLNKTSINSPSYQNIGSLLLGGNNEKKMYLNQLKENAKALIKFVGCIPYRLSGDINARLLQLEVMMN